MCIFTEVPMSRRRCRLLLLPVAALLIAGAPVAPAQAAVTVTELECAEPGTSPLARADGPVRDRSTRGIAADTEIPALQSPTTTSTFSATVPVWFHVLAAGTTPRQGWVSDRQIAEQLEVMNRAYRGGYGGHDGGFRFVHAGTTRTVNPEWFAMETFQAEIDAKTALRRGDAQTLNMYLNSGAGYLGWAYYPSIVKDQRYDVLDGAVVHFDSLPGGKIRNYNLGHTATHEVGHWLGLAHTFEGGCAGHGDHVEDTPAQTDPSWACPVGKDTCASPGADNIRNFMDYSYDSCFTEFTAGQSDRAQKQWLHWRVQVGYL
jgi:hypothetical protein